MWLRQWVKPNKGKTCLLQDKTFFYLEIFWWDNAKHVLYIVTPTLTVHNNNRLARKMKYISFREMIHFEIWKKLIVRIHCLRNLLLIVLFSSRFQPEALNSSSDNICKPAKEQSPLQREKAPRSSFCVFSSFPINLA